MTKKLTPIHHIRFASFAPAYNRPEDVAGDPKLTSGQKRAILASWISDARAVEDAPALRRLDSGAVIEVDAIQRALDSLDESAPRPRAPCERPRPSPRARSVMVRLLSRIGPHRKGFPDDDDDPPPAPAGVGAPLRSAFVAAHRTGAGAFGRLACATA